MGRRLSWNWPLFLRVFAATAYFHLSVGVTFLLLVFLSLFGILGEWAWLAYPVWAINLYPAARAAQWAQSRYRLIAFWHRAGTGHVSDP